MASFSKMAQSYVPGMGDLRSLLKL